MKLGIIGAGVIVKEFLPKLMKLDGLDVVAIQGTPSTIDEVKQMCNENGVAHGVGTFEELLKLDIDTIYVAVPNFLHFDYCKKGLENGLNVIVEKPMTSNYRESKELSDLAREKGLFLFEAITTIYLGNYQKIREWLPRIGEIKLAKSEYSQYSRRYDAFRNGEVLPAFDPNKAGGALMDLGLYNLHYLFGLFGRPEEYRYYPNVERGIDTSGILTLKYPSFQAVSIAAKDCKGSYGGLIQGTDGCIRSEYPPNLVGKITLELNDGTIEEYDDGMAMERLIPEFTAFMKAINSKDLDFCYEKLDESLLVSEIQTEARLNAGIRFPADER